MNEWKNGTHCIVFFLNKKLKVPISKAKDFYNNNTIFYTHLWRLTSQGLVVIYFIYCSLEPRLNPSASVRCAGLKPSMTIPTTIYNVKRNVKAYDL